jgi:hypothetical protein
VTDWLITVPLGVRGQRSLVTLSSGKWVDDADGRLVTRNATALRAVVEEQD